MGVFRYVSTVYLVKIKSLLFSSKKTRLFEDSS